MWKEGVPFLRADTLKRKGDARMFYLCLGRKPCKYWLVNTSFDIKGGRHITGYPWRRVGKGSELVLSKYDWVPVTLSIDLGFLLRFQYLSAPLRRRTCIPRAAVLPDKGGNNSLSSPIISEIHKYKSLSGKFDRLAAAAKKVLDFELQFVEGNPVTAGLLTASGIVSGYSTVVSGYSTVAWKSDSFSCSP